MNLKSLLRALVTIEVAAVFGGVVAEILSERTLPPPLRSYVENEEISDFFAAVGGVLVLLIIVAWVGLWLFARWAPALYAATFVAGLLVSPFGGPYVGSGIGEAFETLSTTAGGAILALTLWSPLRTEFSRKAT